MALLDELRRQLLPNQRLQVTVWDPDDNDFEETYQAAILIVEGLMFKMTAPAEEQQHLDRLMKHGMVVGVLMDAYPNPFIFYPYIHLYQPPPAEGYWMRIPTDTQIEIVQRRRHVRIPMAVPLTVEYPLEDGRWGKMPAMTEDVSGGGMRITGPVRFQKEQEIILKIQFQTSQPLLVLTARVVDSFENRLRLRDDDFYVTACQFLNLDKQHETIIVRECFRRELGLKG